MKVFERLSSWLSGAKRVAITAPAVSSGWSDEELELMLWSEAHQVIGQMELPGRSSQFHAAMLAVDIVENQLLLDSPFPLPPAELLLPGVSCKISLCRQQQLLQLNVQIKDHLLVQGRPAILVHIISRNFHFDRRSSQRISFQRNDAPIMRIQVPMVEQLRASVMNISTSGALLNIFGKHDDLRNFKSPFSAKLQLDESVCPCQHMQLRVQFAAMKSQDTRKLALFIASKQEQALQVLIPSSLAR
jgi:c-di-GMP-binding flagellar brake protein YcgR